MKTHTYTLQLEAPKEEVFAFLSKIENLPVWAPIFCQGVRRSPDGNHLITTMAGELYFRIDADAASGVIDMRSGPSPEDMTYWPARVVERPFGKSLYMITIFQFPGMSEQEFDTQCRAISHDLPNIKRHLDSV